MADDPFEDLLNLEEQFYQDGYKEGAADGAKAGRIEGRSFGLEKGFEKFRESGLLYGKAIVWANRLPEKTKSKAIVTDAQHEANVPESQSIPPQAPSQTGQLPTLAKNPRLLKNITTLYALVESESLSTENTDEAVNDFDDRLKRAQGKAKIIEKMVGEDPGKDRTAATPVHAQGASKATETI